MKKAVDQSNMLMRKLLYRRALGEETSAYLLGARIEADEVWNASKAIYFGTGDTTIGH